MSSTKRKNKSPSIAIKLSSSFMQRTKCRRCGDVGSLMYRILNAPLHKDYKIQIQQFEYIRRHMKFCGEYFIDYEPKYFNKISVFSHIPLYKGYNPLLHRLRDINPSHRFTEFISCNCMLTQWAINYKFMQSQPASNRKSDRVYDKKIR